MKILIGYDGSNCADAALDDLSFAGLPDIAEVQILSVAERWLPPPPPSAYEIVEQAKLVDSPADLLRMRIQDSDTAKQAAEVALKAVKRVRARFPHWTVTAYGRCGSPSSELIHQADQWRPDLIVVGSHGRTAVGRFVLGSVSQRVLTEAQCSVRIARGRVEEPNTAVKIIIGVDGSPASEVAVQAVASRLWPVGSEVMLVAADELLFPGFLQVIPPVAKMIAEDKQWELDWAQKTVNRAASILEAAELKVSAVLRHGDPKGELPKAAEDWHADCIFVGSGGFNSRLERFLLGSVSAAIAARSHCSVEVVRAKSESAPRAT